MPALIEPPEVSQPEVVEALAAVGPAAVELVRTAGDPAQPVTGCNWTVREVAAHLIAGTELYTDLLRGAHTSPYLSLKVDDIAARNRAELDTVLQRGGDLADQLERALDQWQARISAADLPPAVAYHAGLLLAPLRVGALLLGELILHGHDLAATLHRPWRIDPSHADLVVRGMAGILPPYVDPDRARGFSATYQLRLRRRGTYTLRFRDGELTIGGGSSGVVDCHIAADPVAYLLLVCGRIGPLRPVLTGKMVVYGRKPWLAPRLARLIAAP
jgi:uncharacterized protein (TIGR03083 family)